MKYPPPPQKQTHEVSTQGPLTLRTKTLLYIYLLFCISYTGKTAGHQKGSRVSLLCCNAKYTSTRYMK